MHVEGEMAQTFNTFQVVRSGEASNDKTKNGIKLSKSDTK